MASPSLALPSAGHLLHSQGGRVEPELQRNSSESTKETLLSRCFDDDQDDDSKAALKEGEFMSIAFREGLFVLPRRVNPISSLASAAHIHSFSKVLERAACVSCGQRGVTRNHLLSIFASFTHPFYSATHIQLSYLFVVKYIRPSSSTRLASTESSAPHSTLYCTLLNSLSQPAKLTLHGHIVAPCDD